MENSLHRSDTVGLIKEVVYVFRASSQLVDKKLICSGGWFNFQASEMLNAFFVKLYIYFKELV